MSPEQRAEIEARVERSLRRGELGLVREDLKALVEAFPDDAQLALRLEDLEANALPGELTARRPAAPAPMPPPPGGSASHVVEGERLFQLGNYVGAVAAYRQALREQPESELLRERLVELFQLAQAQVGPGPGPALRPTSGPVAPQPPAPAADSPEPPGPSADLPAEAPAPLQERGEPVAPVSWAAPPPAPPARTGAAPSEAAREGARADSLEVLLARIAARRRPGF